ncbi:MAG: ABC transporter permease [Actinomycetota bacterium]
MAGLPDAGPPPELIFRRRVRPLHALKELWRSRELIRTLAERDIRARYKQTALGVGWAVLTPVLLMVVFTVFLRRVATIDTHGVPYPLFAYLGLLPWTFFSTSLNQGGQSLISNVSILDKLYCPREVFPLASIIVAGFDTVISIGVLAILFVVHGFLPQGTIAWVPLLIVVQLIFTAGATMLLSAALVYVRDLRHALPMVLQLGLFVTPVAWGIAEYVPVHLRGLYSALNPLAPVIEGYRETVLYGSPPPWGLLGIAAAASCLYLGIGYAVFKRLETGFADVA